MADDKSKIGKQDRDRVAGGQDYEVQHLAKEAGVTSSVTTHIIGSLKIHRPADVYITVPDRRPYSSDFDLEMVLYG